MTNDWPPSAEDITELPVDDLALRMLRNFVATNTSQLNRGNFTNSSTWHSVGGESSGWS